MLLFLLCKFYNQLVILGHCGGRILCSTCFYCDLSSRLGDEIKYAIFMTCCGYIEITLQDLLADQYIIIFNGEI